MTDTIKLYCHNCGEQKEFSYPLATPQQLCSECREKLKEFLDDEYKRGFNDCIKECHIPNEWGQKSL